MWKKIKEFFNKLWSKREQISTEVAIQFLKNEGYIVYKKHEGQMKK